MYLSASIPLQRRLFAGFLLIGLGVLLVCLVTGLLLLPNANKTALYLTTVLGSSAVIAAGAYSLLYTVKSISAIESELRRIANIEHVAAEKLPGNDPATTGWNAMIERLGDQVAWDRLENRLADTLGKVQQDRLDTVFDQVPFAIGVTNAAGEVIQSNRAFAGIAGKSAVGETNGKSIVELLGFARAHNAQQIATALKRKSRSSTFDTHNGAELSDGVLRVTRTLLGRQSDGPASDIWTIRDVTQQLMAEETRNQFVFTATHELRTPLANIKAYAETLAIEDGIDVEKQKEFCNIINEEATRLARFVDQLLNINQMESGSLALHRHETDLQALIDDVIRNATPELSQKKIEFNTKLPAKWPKLEVDKDKLTSAIVNLVGNAAKYTPEGGRVNLHVEIGDSAIQIHVEDTGIGIAEHELEQIFDKFFRSEDERVRELTGNGLGLAFTNEVALLHGGRLSVSSELNRGSRFSFSIPLS